MIIWVTVSREEMYHIFRNIPEVKIYQCYATHKKFVQNHELYTMH